MNKKLFIVKTTITSVVAAENEEDAKDIAESRKLDIIENDDYCMSSHWEANPVYLCENNIPILPSGWTDECLPWEREEEDDITVGYYISKLKENQ